MPTPTLSLQNPSPGAVDIARDGLIEFRITTPEGVEAAEWIPVHVTGQSLSVGSVSGGAISLSQPVGLLGEAYQVNADESALELATNAGEAQEIPTVGLAYTLAHLTESRAIVQTTGVPSAPYSDLRPNDSPENDSAQNIIDDAGVIASARTAETLDVYLVIIHGESDELIRNEGYQANLEEWLSGTQADLTSAYGESVTLKMVIMMSAANRSYEGGIGGYQPMVIPPQVVAAARANANIYIGGSHYIYSYTDGLHLTSSSYRLMGSKAGQVVSSIARGLGWRSFYPASVVASGSTIQVNYNVPVEPIVIDTTTIPQVRHWGFRYSDTEGPGAPEIRSVAVTTPTQLTITLSSRPRTGAVLSYALESRNTGAGDLYLSPRGNIRDSDATDLGPHNPGSANNWALPFSDSVSGVTGEPAGPEKWISNLDWGNAWDFSSAPSFPGAVPALNGVLDLQLDTGSYTTGQSTGLIKTSMIGASREDEAVLVGASAEWSLDDASIGLPIAGGCHIRIVGTAVRGGGNSRACVFGSLSSGTSVDVFLTSSGALSATVRVDGVTNSSGSIQLEDGEHFMADVMVRLQEDGSGHALEICANGKISSQEVGTALEDIEGELDVAHAAGGSNWPGSLLFLGIRPSNGFWSENHFVDALTSFDLDPASAPALLGAVAWWDGRDDNGKRVIVSPNVGYWFDRIGGERLITDEYTALPQNQADGVEFNNSDRLASASLGPVFNFLHNGAGGSVWMRVRSTTPALARMLGTGGVTGRGMYLDRTASGTANLYVFNDSGQVGRAFETGAFATGVSVNIAAVVGASEPQLYVDGVLGSNTGVYSGPLASGDAPGFAIGSTYDTTSTEGDCVVEQALIFPSALSQADVDALEAWAISEGL